MSGEQPRMPDPRMIQMNQAPSWFSPATPVQPAEPEPPAEAKESFVRPFIVTGGRTMPLRDDLRIETLVVANRAALTAPLRFELQTVVRLCQQPRSVAEVAATLHVPLGVAKVVIGDLMAAGHVTVHQATELAVSTIERIRDLVRAL
ncbi:DUF742 domain-containing protein [Kutzneria sp. CA-103260]|uniref:DUF742 domain-containing protein n=1 Tax=Kutzneria sp. CA-103260 TaxID=2802641 RepID=UPI001BA904E3|nr:DUF742 domain-containing protein [Kutzneria sp. CA-103260]QUQ67912.1 hypothetical protein JJ691_56500 [Kutzneria sp. CA-103260]